MNYSSILAVGGALLATVASAQMNNFQLDLICSGEKTRYQQNGSLSNMSRVKTPWTQRFALDLQSRLFCERGCSAPQRILFIAPDQFQLGPKTEVGELDEIVIDRVDGKFFRRHTRVNLDSPESDFTDQYAGTCSVASFTAFPKTKF